MRLSGSRSIRTIAVMVLSALPLLASDELGNSYPINAPRDRVFNAAYRAARTRWALSSANLNVGSVWFTADSAVHGSKYDCGVLLSKDSGPPTRVRIIVRGDEHRISADEVRKMSAKIAEEIGHHLDDPVAPEFAETKIIDVQNLYKRVVRGYEADAVYAAAVATAKSHWSLATTDPAERRLIFLSIGDVSHNIRTIAFLVHVVDLENREVRVEVKFRNTIGGRVPRSDLTAGVCKWYFETLTAELSGAAYKGAATK